MALILTIDQKVSVAVSFIDRAGNPALVQGVPFWDVSDSTIVTVIPSEDGMSAVVDTVGVLGTAQVSVRADADLGEGIVDVIGILDVEAVAGQAVAATITAGTPEPR